MGKEGITLIQLLALIFNFLLGSAVVLGVGLEAKQDAWIGTLIATLLGIGFMYFYYTLNRMLPSKNLFEIMEYCFTRPVAILLSFCYSIYFLYIASRVIREFGELITTAVLPITPISVITLSIMLVIAYILYLGLEVLARVAEVFTPYLLVFIFMLIIFLLAGGEIQIENIQPVLGEGIKPLLKALSSLIAFPFGELLAFTVILSSVTQFIESKKMALIGVMLSGIFLTIGTLLIIVTLGVERIQKVHFPLLAVARKVSIAQFIERIDVFVVFIMLLGILVKGSVYFYGAIKGLEYIFKIPYRYFAVPISTIISLFSILISVNYAEHLEEGNKITPPFHLPMQLMIPAVMLVVLIWKKKKHNSGKNGVK